MSRAAGLGVGLIEGFYGHPWSWRQRRDMLSFLQGAGYRFYIYAPKSDQRLRGDWRRAHRGAAALRLGRFADACRQSGLAFGLGLSPLGLQQQWNAAGRSALASKLRALRGLRPDILGILFDDMPAPGVDPARVQAEICEFAAAQVPHARLIMCPTYYSRDPVLERLFGVRPPDYWERLGESLAPTCEVFWTGTRVCASAHSASDLADIGARLRRRPVLWDNYPVNDGARSSRFLHLDAFRGRPAHLGALLAGHAVNPMLQAWLSRLPLLSLADSYRLGRSYRPQRAFRRACRSLCGPELGACLEQDLALFQLRGLDRISEAQRRRLRARYAAFDAAPAREIVDWLEGRYRFDPACLTD